MSITRTQTARQLMEMGGEALQAGAPEIQLEGNQIPQREEMASMPDLDAELYQLFLDCCKILENQFSITNEPDLAEDPEYNKLYI